MLPPQPDVTGALPPPEKLKAKVLLKGKMIPFSDEDDEEEIEGKEEPVKKSSKKGKQEVDFESRKKRAQSTHGGKIAAELSSLIHLKAVHFKSFENSKGKHSKERILTYLFSQFKTMGNVILFREWSKEINGKTTIWAY